VAFQSLYATDLCGGVGSTYNSTTLAFAQNELSTAIAYYYDPSEVDPVPPYIPDIFTEATWGMQ